ncbi:MAG: hypothetical protein JXA69_07175 [Phycisphaerae bacterium]|nr:hypothetical protein [Phycisphaerae bacterium]
MLRAKAFRWIAVVSTGLLLSSGCSLDNWWPWAAGAGVLGVLGLAT